MAGPILHSDTKVAWASRINSPTFARNERIQRTPAASSPDSSSSRIILPLSEHRFADSSPSPFLTSSPIHNRLQPPTSEGVPPSPSSGPGWIIDVDQMRVPAPSNDGDDLRTPNLEPVSAPAELHQPHRKITIDTPEFRVSLDVASGRHERRDLQSSQTKAHSTPISKPMSPLLPNPLTKQAINELRQKESPEFHLDRAAPFRALRHPPVSASTGAGGQAGSIMGTIEEQRGQSGTPEAMLDPAKKDVPPVANEADKPERTPSPGEVGDATDKRVEDAQTWGEPFRLQWIKTERLPFYRTRHLRNPWNHDREVKVSRDGTELEPGVGQALLDEWDRVADAPSVEKASQQPGQGGTGSVNRQQGRGKGGGVWGGQRGKR
jgi:hypothetical protein